MTRRYDLQDILDRFAATQSQRFRELSDAIARRILELLGGGTIPNDPPEAPTNLTATTDQEFRVVLDWDPVSGALGYNLYRAPRGSLEFSLLAQTATSDYIDSGLPADSNYLYYVTAYNSAGESGPSSTELGTSLGGSAPPLPDTPANFRSTSNENQVILAWDAFTGGTISCQIERSVDQINWSVVANTASLTFTDTNVSVGQTLYYRAYGVSATGVTSPATPTLTVTVVDGDITAPPVPVLLSGTPANKMISVTWEGVLAPDLAGYEIGWGTSSGVYTDTSPLISGTQGNITGLTNGTSYYFAVRSVDTSLNQNKSAWSNEKQKIAIDTIDPANPADPPTAPTNVTSTSPAVNEIRVAFTPGVSDFLVRHRLYARVKGAGAWTQIDQELQPATNLGQDVTIFQGSLGWDPANPITWEFYVTAVDSYSQESAPSEIVEDLVDGTDWIYGPGGGEINGQNINGDTGLGPNHRAPIAPLTFDYVIDVSDPAQYSGDAIERAAAIFNNRRGLSPSNPDFIQLSTDAEAQIAILLPSQTVNKRLTINTGLTSAGGSNPRESANFDFGGDPGYESRVALHFVGPWAQGDDTFTEAQTRMRDDPNSATLGYKRTNKDENNKARFDDNTGADIIVGDITRQNAKGGFYFWNWDVEISSKDGIRLGSDGDRGSDYKSHDFDGVFALCRIHQDAVEPKVERIGQRGITARYIRPTLLGCFIDLPWQSGSAVQALSPLRGDYAVTRTRFARTGGAAFETYTRANFDSGLPEGTDPGTLMFTGVRHWDNWATIDDGIGRASEDGVYFFDIGGIEQDVSFLDCHVIEEKASNFRRLADWPPATPYDWRVYTAFVRRTNSALRIWHRGGARQLSTGYRVGEVTASNCLFYSKTPLRPVVDIDHASSISLTSVGAFTDEQVEALGYDSSGASTSLGDSSLTAYRYGNGNPYKPIGSPNALGAMSATGLNTATMRTTLASSYSLTANEVAVANANVDFAGLIPSHFPVTDAHSFVSLTGPGQDYVQPVGLNPTWPAAQRINAPALYQARNTLEQNKSVRIPVLRQLRAARVSQNIPWISYVKEYGADLGMTPGDPVMDPSTTSFYHHAASTDISLFFGSGSVPFGSQYNGIEVPPANLEKSSDLLTVKIKDLFDDQGIGSHSMTNMAKRGVDEFGLGFETAQSQFGYVPPDGFITMQNCHWDGQFREDADTWANRWYNTPKLAFIDCDIERIKEEHAIYTDTPHDFYARGVTASQIGSQVFQVQSRAYDGGKPTDNVPVTYPMHCVIEDCHMVDVTGTEDYGTRPSYSMTLGNRGTSEFPGRVKVFDTSWVCGGFGPESQAGRSGQASGQEVCRSYGPLVVSLEQGMQTLFDFNRSNRANTGTINEWAWVKNCFFHAEMGARAMLKFQAVDTIIIEDTALICDRSDATTNDRWFRPPISIDSSNDTIEADPERHGSRKLILRNVYCDGTGSPLAQTGNNSWQNSHGHSRFSDDPNRQAGNIHCPGIQVEYDLTPGSSSDPIYSGPYRDYTDIEGNTLDMTTRWD